MSINSVPGVRTDINDLLTKIREVSNKSKSLSESHSVGATKSFDDIMSVAKGALTNVSQVQTESEKVKNAYISGDSSVSMSQVVVASQKSKLAFEGLVSVRNKILEAYKEIMNMPV
ncbi:MAG: flagellar hook-basal body complex protein FliE [Gammaproteobacteria bacterium]|nr:flagellar hook-basal body complex protein FliE [Gammaproteobacteria bacterium]